MSWAPGTDGDDGGRDFLSSKTTLSAWELLSQTDPNADLRQVLQFLPRI